MSRYKAYPSYKETRHSWLDSVPAHWEMLPLKFLTAQHVTDGPHETPEFIDEGVPFLSVDGIQNNQLVFEGCRYISREDHARYSIKCKPNQGDVLLGKAASVGKVAHVDTDIEFNVWSPLAVIRPRSEKTGRFIYYSLQSALLQMQCDMYSNANTQKNLGMSTIDNLAFACPTDDEAEQVASFLDHETAKIDALIEKQQRLIELLKEKRQAVISHAVTKGLNPNAPMKDSGVEWLGELPAHWQIKSLRYLGNCQNGINIGAEYFGSGYPFVSYGDVYRNDTLPIQVEGLVQSTHTDREIYSVRTGDILFTRTSETVDEIGFSAACLQTLENATFAGFLIRFRPNTTEVAVNFAKHYFRSTLMRSYFVQEMNLVTRASLSQDLLKRLPVPLPPENEQLEIAEYLDAKSRVFSKLTSNAETAIQLLKERRTALISAAVTGKIDVRDWQATA